MKKDRITLKQVATHAGVSYQTVSKVIHNQIQVSKETEERIWKAIAELGYHPNQLARSLRSQRSNLIGYSWEPTPPDQANPILDQFLQSMAQALESTGYHLLTFPYHPGNAWLNSYRELIDTNRVDGFVLSSVEFQDPRILFLQQRSFPYVAFGRSNSEWDIPFVDVDGAEGIRMATTHLIEQGHRRIAVLAWPMESRVGQNRMDGYLDCLREAGIEPRSEWIIRGEGTYAYGISAAQELLRLPAEIRPTAIVAFNDIMAAGAMYAIQAEGLQVGTDVAVTGFDDSPMVQYLTPPLTTIRQPIWEVGQQVTKILMFLLGEKDAILLSPSNRQVLLRPRLIIRKSSIA
jgi:DNA-binding LacI/PurR family transcriptional regulator